MARPIRATPLELDAAVQALRDGELVAFPTETVYGLGGNAQHAAAVRKIFELKGRPAAHPLIVHLDSARFLHRWAREVPEAAAQARRAFLARADDAGDAARPNVHDLVTGGQDTVAIRVPSHPMAQQLLTRFWRRHRRALRQPLRSCSPTRAEHVREELGDAVRMVLDGGECQVGLESTIVSCLDGEVRLLRPGRSRRAAAREVGGAGSARDAAGARVPGSAAGALCPRRRSRLVPPAKLSRLVAELSSGGKRIASAGAALAAAVSAYVTWVNAGTRPEQYVHDLYANLRALDTAPVPRDPGAGSAGGRTLGCGARSTAARRHRSPKVMTPVRAPFCRSRRAISSSRDSSCRPVRAPSIPSTRSSPPAGRRVRLTAADHRLRTGARAVAQAEEGPAQALICTMR